jgi:hypothetical protein
MISDELLRVSIQGMLDYCKQQPDARETDCKLTVDEVLDDPAGFADMLRAALEAVAPMIRAEGKREGLEEAMRLVPTTSAKPGESNWARGFYDCQMQWAAVIHILKGKP